MKVLALLIVSLDIRLLMKKLLILVVFILLGMNTLAQEWKLISDKDSINIYTRKVEGQFVKDVRIKTILTTTLSELIAALEDFDLQDAWVRNTIFSRKIEELSPEHYLFHVATDFPFPAKDRDVVIDYRRNQDSLSRIVNISYQSIKDKVQVDPSLVRIPYLEAAYVLIPLPGDRIDVEYYLRADIGGKIPKWIINMAISVGPRDTMIALKEVLSSGKYAGRVVPGLIEPSEN